MYRLCRKRGPGLALMMCTIALVTALPTMAQPGTLDTNFTANVSATDPSILIESLAVAPDGKLIVGGRFSRVSGVTQSAVTRLHTNGLRDGSFPASAVRWINAVAIDQSNRVLLAGVLTNVNGIRVTNLARLRSDGSLDSGFTPPAFDGALYAVTVLPEGKILVGGSFRRMVQSQVFAPQNIIRLNEDGTPDEAFSANTRGANETVYAFARQSDGKVLVGGAFTTFDGEPRAGVVRLNADTALDSTFGCSVTGFVYSVAAQADGRILIAGSFRN